MTNNPLHTFPALYLATILMLAGSGLFTTYLGLRLTDEGVSELVIGSLTTAYYFGLVFGAKIGHRLIANFGHIRAYVACAGLATIITLFYVLIENVAVWIALRFIIGVVMMNQYMVLESWLNEQAEDSRRGAVFAGYMIATDFGLMLGQAYLFQFPQLSFKPLIMIAIFFAGCLIPLAMTRRVHPAKISASSLEVSYFWRKVPQALLTIFLVGIMVGSFYGLAPVYAKKSGLDTASSSLFVMVCIASGFIAQWPMGWLSDRFNRATLIRMNALLFAVINIPLWGLSSISSFLLMAFGFLGGLFLFTFYPLTIAFANDNIEQSKRVSLSALLLATYGMGASIGPFMIGLLMSYFQAGTFYMACSGTALLIALYLKPDKVKFTDEGQLQHVVVTTLISTVGSTLDPRIDDEYPEHLVIDAPTDIGRSDNLPDTNTEEEQNLDDAQPNT